MEKQEPYSIATKNVELVNDSSQILTYGKSKNEKKAKKQDTKRRVRIDSPLGGLLAIKAFTFYFISQFHTI